MLRFGKRELMKKELYDAKEEKNWNVNVDNTVISNLIEAKNNSKYLID